MIKGALHFCTGGNVAFFPLVFHQCEQVLMHIDHLDGKKERCEGTEATENCGKLPMFSSLHNIHMILKRKNSGLLMKKKLHNLNKEI